MRLVAYESHNVFPTREWVVAHPRLHLMTGSFPFVDCVWQSLSSSGFMLQLLCQFPVPLPSFIAMSTHLRFPLLEEGM